MERDPLVALQKAKQIFACYRKDEAHDPEMYAAAVAAVLSGYPAFVVDYVADPRTGIAGTSKWLPSVAEIKEACEAKLNRIVQDVERERRIEKQLLETAQEDNLAHERARRPDYEQLKSKYGDGKGGWLDTESQGDDNGKNKTYSGEEKAAFLESAKQAGQEIAQVKLSDAARTLLDMGAKP